MSDKKETVDCKFYQEAKHGARCTSRRCGWVSCTESKANKCGFRKSLKEEDVNGGKPKKRNRKV